MQNVNALHSVLIVDDQEGIRTLLYEVFSDEGYHVELAADGMEALKKYGTVKPSLILLDVKMSGMSGLKTLQEIRKYDWETEIIMMTAYNDLDIIQDAKKFGVKHYVTKPFDINELRFLVKGLLLDVAKKEKDKMSGIS